MRLHILGICGTFMAGIAQLGKAKGFEISGSDAQVYPPMSDLLASQGIELTEGYDPDQLNNLNCPVVVGNVMRRGLPVVEALLNSELKFISGPQWLHENILHHRKVLAVAGTHGKTTTSSMLAWILDYAGLKPGFLIGGIPLDFGVSARLGESEWFVVEADEYDTAFFDKRSKFVHYHPHVAILGNLEYDHADIFPDVAAIQTQFHHLVRIVPSSGQIITRRGDGHLNHVLAKGCWTPCATFGSSLRPETDSAETAVSDIKKSDLPQPPVTDWSAGNIRADLQEFDVMHDGQSVARVAWTLQGRHNIDNALAAIAASAYAGVDPKTAAAALSCFKGVKRRLELKGTIRGVTVYDDFAHHPTAIEGTLRGLKASHANSPVRVVLEMRSNTLRMGVHHKRLPEALSLAEDVYFWQRPGSKDLISPIVSAMGGKATRHTDIDQLALVMAERAQAGDIWVIMSQGGFGGLHEKFLAALKQ